MPFSPKQVLEKYWGFTQFRPLQEQIVQSVLAHHDTLALLPTGGGKSICFQVPAMVLEGTCLVVSPLIALMKDQVANLKKRGINAEALYSGMFFQQTESIISNCIYGQVKFLYVSPERLATLAFREALKKMKINLLAVDEAHCISQWGYDFRPQYLQIAEVRELLPKVPVLALTATATPKVAADITEKLHFKNKQLFSKSFVRKNLSYVVRQTFDKNAQLLSVLQKVAGSSVVYVNSRKATKQIADFLKQNKVSADFYHAGLSTSERNAKQENWIEGKTRVMVCTNAFGMGIDKPDVRTVVHMEVPQSLEAYFQEAGRAGRDEQKAYAVLLINQNDKNLLKESIEKFPSSAQLRHTYDALCNYLKIPLHQKPENSFPFNVAAFATDAKMPVREVLTNVQLLAQMEIIALSETSFPYATIKCLVSKDALMKLYAANPNLEATTKMILRTSEGVFEDFTVFHESEVAKRLNFSLEELAAKLQELQRLQIFAYRPITDEPQVSILHARVEAKQLIIDNALLELRKQQTTDRVKAMLHYISTNHFCRSKMLVSYFGEKFAEPCGVCDVCIAEKKSGLQQAQFAHLVKSIEAALSQPKTLEELAAITNQKTQVISQVLQRLSDAELIKADAKSGAFVWL
jgi:ATP-dependent DNA helicase RecQ